MGWFKGKRVENYYLKHGTVVGPVTQEMIDWCQNRFQKIDPEMAKEQPEFWPDFIPAARKALKVDDD